MSDTNLQPQTQHIRLSKETIDRLSADKLIEVHDELEETFDADHLYHSYEDQPARVCFEADTGIVMAMLWYNHGELHRTTGPAEMYTANFCEEDAEFWLWLNDYNVGIESYRRQCPEITDADVMMWQLTYGKFGK